MDGDVRLFARRPSFGKLGVPGFISLDASLEENHSVHNMRTENPIATGAIITDHVITRPDEVTITGIVTATPDEWKQSFSFSRHIKAWQRFVDLARSRVPFDVVTTMSLYTDMVVDDLDTSRTAADGKSLVITARCSKIEFSSVDAAQELADAALELGLAEADLGVQGTGELG